MKPGVDDVDALRYETCANRRAEEVARSSAVSVLYVSVSSGCLLPTLRSQAMDEEGGTNA